MITRSSAHAVHVSICDSSYRHILADACSIFDSKMAPLLLSFDNFEDHGGPLQVIYKRGDDLRQDIVVIAGLRLMDLILRLDPAMQQPGLFNICAVGIGTTHTPRHRPPLCRMIPSICMYQEEVCRKLLEKTCVFARMKCWLWV